MDKGLLAKFQSVVNYFNKKNFSSHDFLILVSDKTQKTHTC